MGTVNRFGRHARRIAQLEKQLELLVDEQASGWVDAMKNPTASDRLAFGRWLKKRPSHATEYLLMEALDSSLASIDPQRQHSVDEALASAPHEVVPMPGRRDGSRDDSSSPAWWRICGLAATVATIAVAAWWMSPWSGREWQSVSTRVGEQRVVELEDGSSIHVNTQSRLRVRLSGESRDIQLLAGEALFKVARDPARPFLVHAGKTTIRALGTQFNVHREREDTQVAVLEGKVAVSVMGAAANTPTPTLLIAGEEVSVQADKAVTKRPAADVARAVAWQQRRLVFRMDTLEDIAYEFNRYNRSPKIEVEGAALQARRLSGVFDATDPGAFARALGHDQRLRIEVGNGQIVIREP